MARVIDSEAQKLSTMEFSSWVRSLRKGRDACLILGCLGALASPFVPDRYDGYHMSNHLSRSSQNSSISGSIYRDICYELALTGFLMGGAYSLQERLDRRALRDSMSR